MTKTVFDFDREFGFEMKEGEEAANPAEIVTKALDGFKGTFETRMEAVANDNKKLADRLDKIEAKAARPGIVAANDNDAAIETKALNAFLRGGVASLDDVEKKTLNAGTPASGGYVTAPEYSTAILEKLVQFSPLRALANKMTIGTSEVYLPVLDSSITGGYVTEIGNRASTEPTFDQMNFKTFEYAGYVPVSRQLLEDSFVDLQSYIAGQVVKQFGKAEATSFMVGDGDGKPTGLLHTPGDYTAITANADGTDILAKIIEAFYKLPGAYAAQGSWLMRRETMGLIRAAADNAAKGTLWSDSLANGTPATLLGRPVYESIDMDLLPTVAGTTYPVVFGDMASAYQIVDRVGVGIMRDDYTGAANGIVKFHARYRHGGGPLLTEAAVLVKSTKAA
jgi:HK97 family phage major capsid protein